MANVFVKKNLQIRELQPRIQYLAKILKCLKYFSSAVGWGKLFIFLIYLQFLPRLHYQRNFLLAEERLHHFSAKWKETQNLQFLGVLVIYKMFSVIHNT